MILESSSLLISETKVRRRPGVMPDLVGVELGLAVLTKPPVAEGTSSARGRKSFGKDVDEEGSAGRRSNSGSFRGESSTMDKT